MRGFLVGLLAAIGIVLLPLADLGVWVDRQLLDTPRFVAVTADILDEPDVQAALADRVTDRLVQRYPGLTGASPAIRAATETVVRSRAFDVVFAAAARRMHRQLVDGEDRLVLDLDAMIPLIRNGLPAEIAGRIPRPIGLAQIEVVRREDAPALWAVVEGVQKYATLLPIVCLMLLVGAVLIARRRAAAAAAIGGLCALTLLAVAAIFEFARALLDSFTGDQVQRDAFDAGGNVLFGSFTAQTLLLVGVAVVAVVVGLIVSVRGTGNERSSEWA